MNHPSPALPPAMPKMQELGIYHIDATESKNPQVRVKFRVGNAPAGEAVGDFLFDYSIGDRELVRWYLEEFLYCPWGAYEGRAAAGEQAVKSLGDRLFKAVFRTSEQQTLYQLAAASWETTSVVIHASGSSARSLPWEFMRDSACSGSGALAQCARSFIRILPRRRRFLPLPAQETLNVLLVICRPGPVGQDVPFQSVARPVVDTCRRYGGRVSLSVLRPPTFSQLTKTLSESPGRYQVVHFDGHGGFPSIPDGTAGPFLDFLKGELQGHLLFESDDPSDERGHAVTGSDLGRLLSNAHVSTVLLNACQSGMADIDLPFSSVASQLVEAGVSSVVAMAYSVYVQSAAKFMGQLFESFLGGEGLARAVQRGRAALAAEPVRFSVAGSRPLHDWVVPVLFQAEGEDTLLQAIATDAEPDRKQSGEVFDVTIPLTAVAGYALFRWLKNYFDRQRGAHDLDLVAQQVKLVDDLVANGVPRAQAEKTVSAMLKQVRQRGADDPAFQAVLALIDKTTGGSTP